MEDSWFGFGEIKHFEFWETLYSYTYFKGHFIDTVSGNESSPFTNYFIEDEI